MGLPKLFSGGKKTSDDQTKQYLALLITDATVQAGFWQISQGRIALLENSSVLSYADAKDLLVQADIALQGLGKASENVDEVILGLEFNWVGQDGIADAKKPLLKQLVQELSLKPVGFVVSTEALFHFLTSKDAQISTLLVQYATDHITVSIVSRGKLVSSERVGRSEDAGADVQEATARLLSNQEHLTLPPRVHLVSAMLTSAQMQDQKKQLANFDWKSINPKIVHQPIVEMLPPETVLDAVIQEGGKAVAEFNGFTITANLDKAIDVADGESPDGEQDTPAHQAPQLFSQEFTTPTKEELEGKSQRMTTHQASHKASTKKPSVVMNWMQHHLFFVFGGFATGLLTLLLLGFFWLQGSKQAVVQLTLNAKSVIGDVTITLDPTIASSQPEKLLIKADIVEEEITETKTIPTTGITLVGEKATGTVAISNKTDEEKTIAAGTQLTSGSLVFTLDEEVKIASASVSQSSDGETKKYGRVETKVTAAKIGAESNIVANKQLSVGTFAESSVSAESTSSFTGGASREVRVFSAEDAEALTSAVTKMILDKATAQLKQESGSGTYTIPTGKISVSSNTFDAKENDEVASVTLTLAATATGVRYQSEDLQSLVSTALADQIPEGYSLSSKEPSILTQPADDTSETTTSSNSASTRVVLKANITAQALPNFDQDAFKQEIKGQSVSSAEAMLRGRSEVKDVVIELQPPIAKTLSNSIPGKIDAIKIEIAN